MSSLLRWMKHLTGFMEDVSSNLGGMPRRKGLISHKGTFQYSRHHEASTCASREASSIACSGLTTLVKHITNP